MWQGLSKFLNRKEPTFPAWMKSYVTVVESKAEKERFVWELTEEITKNPPGHKVYFLIGDTVCYAVKDHKDRISLNLEQDQ